MLACVGVFGSAHVVMSGDGVPMFVRYGVEGGGRFYTGDLAIDNSVPTGVVRVRLIWLCK